MAVQDIIAYIRSNEKTFSRETLILRLCQAGYPEEEIQAALRMAGGVNLPESAVVKVSVSGSPWGKIGAGVGGFLLGAVIYGAAAVGMIILAIATAFGGIENTWIFIVLGAAIFLVAGGIFLFIMLRRKHPNFLWVILIATVIFGLFTAWAAFMIVNEFGYIRNNINIIDARGRSRDARRVADVKQLQLALELYFDANGGYPENLRELQPKFIPVIPRDPVTQIEYIYEKRADGSYYMAATLEDPSARYLQNDINTGNQLYEVSESPGFVTDQGAQSKQALDLGYVLNGRPWGPEQATGAPNSPSILGDHGTAWASLTEDNQDEWLLLSYEKSIMTSAILVYESYNPGALRQIDQVSGERVYTLWQGRDPVMVSKDNRYVARIELGRPIMLSRIRLEIKSIEVQGWNEIDAVGLEDKDGKIYWAAHAEASSSYAEPIPPGG